MIDRRKFVSVVAATSTATIAGCAGGSNDQTINGWDIRDREAEAWENLTEGMDVYDSINEAAENELLDAREQLNEASEIYNQLRDETRDNLEGEIVFDVMDFFNRLEGMATAAGNVVGISLNEDVPGGNDPEPFISSVHTHIDEAANLWENTEELQKGLVDRSFQ